MKKPCVAKLVKLTRSNRPLIVTLLCAGALGAAGHSAFAVNAAWDIDAASGNFNTAQWTSGATVPVAGGTYTVVSGDALFFGTQTTGVTALTNDLTGATFAGLTFNAGASAFTIGGNSFTLGGNITNSSTNLQTINNDISAAAGRTYNGGTGGLALGGTITATIASTYVGIVNLNGATTVDGGANNNQGFGTFGNNVNATVTISNGGSLDVKGTTGSTNANTIIANNNSTSILNVGAADKSSSGTLTMGGGQGIAIGNNSNSANGTLNINSGTATINSGSTTATDFRSFVALGRDTGNGTINLNGGTLATDRNFVRDGNSTPDASGSATFNFAGGTLKALASQTDWLNSSTKNTNQLALTSVTATNTSTIDSNGFSVAINNNISGTGGFNITSSTAGGTVILGGTNTFTGPVTVNSGTLSLTTNVSLDSAIVLTLASNTSLTLAFSTGSQTVEALDLNGTFVAPGTYTTSDLNTLGSGSSITFSGSGGTLTVTAVPEPATMALVSIGLVCVLFGFRRGRKLTV